nr:VPLPA-CTERM sorting domain-containing protein [uncultured Desulfobacter sp.]
MKRLLLVLAGMILMANSAQAMETIAYTGFEEAAASSGKYTSTGTVGEALPEQNGVTLSYEGGEELGFNTYLISGSGPSDSSENGDYIGVTSYSPHNGSNSFEIEDADDVVELRLDTVDLTDYIDVTVSAYIKVDISSYTNYEAADYIQMSVVTDVGTYYLFDMDGDELDALIADGAAGDGYAWLQYSVDIDDAATSAQFILTVSTNGSLEGAQLDDVYFTGTSTTAAAAVPVPAAAWLLGSGLLGLVCLNRKNS